MGTDTMIFHRYWAMPNSRTFLIPPIKEFVERNIAGAKVIIDPFANDCKYGTVTNDINTEYDFYLTLGKEWEKGREE